MSETIEITRYPNRRLYDRSQKKYVTLGDIEQMVLDGNDVRVRDSKSDQELTRLILTQIILERHPERLRMFPVAFLHAILRADHLAVDWLTAYFGQAMSYMDRIGGGPAPPFVPGIDLLRSMLPTAAESTAVAETAEAPGQQPGDESDDAAGVDVPPARDEGELADRLAAMERRLKQLEGQRSGK